MAEVKKAPKKFVDEINKQLDDFGGDAISEDKGSAFGAIGYEWQYLADAVNEVLGPDGWYYDLLELTVEPKSEKSFYAEAQVRLHLNLGGSEFAKRGVTVGSCINRGRGDAQKGAITDALKKGFSLFSIGNKAMRGELGAPKKNSEKPKEKEPKPGSKYMDFVTLINEATTVEELDAVQKSFVKARDQKDLTPKEVEDIKARGKNKRAKLKD